MALWVRTDASSWGDARPESMRVLLLGVPRTVSGPMRAASKILGRCEPAAAEGGHGPLDIDAWTDAVNAQFFGKGAKRSARDWEEVLGHCEIRTDAGDPSTTATLAQELAPTRSPRSSPPGSPARSAAPVAKLGRNKPFVVAACLDARLLRRLRPLAPLVWLTFFGDFPTARAALARPAATGVRLLEHRVGDGWERVCILLERERESDADVAPEDGASPPVEDARAFGEKMHRLMYGVFQGLGGTVVMQLARVGSVGVSIFFAHRNM